jgi:site-specific DNA recombinase
MEATEMRPSGRIAIYVRVSSRGQEDNESIPSQIAACVELAHDLGYTQQQIDVFEEVHTGEELWERDEMSRLRKLIEHRVYEGLVVYCVDRLSRKVTHQMIIEEECRHNDCPIHYVQGGPSNTREGRLVRQVEGIVAEMEHEKIVERTNRGRREKIKAGKIVGNGEPPFGYLYSRDDRGKPIGLMPDPMLAPYVVGMFEKLSRGQSLCAIARWLNSEHVPVPGAGKKRRLTQDVWYSASVRYIVNNTTYKGEVYIGKQRIEKDEVTKKKRLVRKPPEEWVRMDVDIPFLVSPELWDAANERLHLNKLRSARNNRHQDRFLLRAGFALCGECGGIMYAKHDPKIGDFYACGSQWRENKRDRCINPASMQASQLDPAVWSVVEFYLANPQQLIDFLEEKAKDENAGSLQPEIDKLDAEIGKLTTRVRNAFEELVSIEDADIKESLRGQIALWQKHLAQFKSDRDTLVSKQAHWLNHQEQRSQFVARLTNVSRELSRLDMDTKRSVLDALGVKVKVYKAARKGPQEPDAPPRWVMTWDVPLSPDDIVNESRTISIQNRMVVYWSWEGESFVPAVA